MLRPFCTFCSPDWGKTSYVSKRCGIIWIFSPEWAVRVLKRSWSQCGPPGAALALQEQHWPSSSSSGPPAAAVAPSLGPSGGSAASDCGCFLSLWRHPDSHVGTWERWKILGITRRLIIITFSFVLCGTFFFLCVRAAPRRPVGSSDRCI